MAAAMSYLTVVCFVAVVAGSNWAKFQKAVIDGHNTRDIGAERGSPTKSGLTVDQCKAKCESERSFVCRSIETVHQSGYSACILSDSIASTYGLTTRPQRYRSAGAYKAIYWERFMGKTVHIPNAAIEHYRNYRKTLYHVSLAKCTAYCDCQSWCKSFAFHKRTGSCCLSDKTAADVGGLKHDFKGHPYDYYELAPKTRLLRRYESLQPIAPSSPLQKASVCAALSLISLGGIAMGVFAFRRTFKQKTQGEGVLLDLEGEDVHVE